jgi:hypothetical protein
MSNRQWRADTEPTNETHTVPWDWLERHAGPAFMTGGAALVASILVPVALALLTDLAWAAGLLLVGVAVLGFAAGLLGLYPRSRDAAPRLSVLGIASTAVAGVAAFGLIAMGALALAAGILGVDLGKPMGVFATVALSMGIGLAIGLSTFGIALWTIEETSTVTPALLIGGGVALFVPAVGKLLRIVVGTASPSWLLFPVLVSLSLVGVTIGYVHRRRDSSTQS